MYGFVFSKDKRFINNFGVNFGVLLIVGFASVFFYDLIMGIGDRLANALVVLFSLGISVLMIIGSKKNASVLSLQYSIESNLVKNFTKSNIVQINTKRDIYFSELYLLLHSKGGARWEERYYLLSNLPIPKILNYESGGLRLPRRLSESNVILLPATQNTNMWIKKEIVDISAPRYPRIAYLKR